MTSDPEPDLEANTSPEEFLQGYAEFSEFKGSDPALSIYRRYDTLATRNLLYLEAEIQLLELQLKEFDTEDQKLLAESTNNNEKRHVDETARCWEAFVHLSDQNDERAKKRMNLILRLRSSMKEYEEALLRRNRIVALQAPDHNSASAFQNWFYHRVPLRGSGFHLLDNESDFCTLYTGGEADRLSTFIQRHLGYHIRSRKAVPKSWHLPGSKHPNLFYYSDAKIAWIVAVMSVVIASILLIGAIVALYFVHDMGRRLGIVGVFTAAFAASLGLLTNARRAEIFGSTAAYAAVLVVFVGVNN